MPSLKKIVIQNFRNIELQELEFSPKMNCICGGNGEGKTNLLDAIWYLSMTKSAFLPGDKFGFRYGCDSFGLSGTYAMESGPDTRISIQVSGNGEKKVKRDDKQYTRLSDHIGLIPVVMVSPMDANLVMDAAEDRRKFVNSVLSQVDKTYLSNVQIYLRLLQQRNKLLKEQRGDEKDLLEVIDQKMATVTRPIYDRRREFCEVINPLLQEYYGHISGSGEQVRITYKSNLEKYSFLDLCKASRERDFIMGFTTAGPHRDDFIFEMDGHQIRRSGSQGQQKSFLVALKFSQYSLMKDRCGFAPMLLLDDLFDKLDMGRVHNLLEMVSGDGFGQIFISDSNKVRLDSIVTQGTFYEAEGGVFKRNE